jgi:hypothetical protein
MGNKEAHHILKSFIIYRVYAKTYYLVFKYMIKFITTYLKYIQIYEHKNFPLILSWVCKNSYKTFQYHTMMDVNLIKTSFWKLSIISKFIVFCPTINWNLELENLDHMPKTIWKNCSMLLQCSTTYLYVTKEV